MKTTLTTAFFLICLCLFWHPFQSESFANTIDLELQLQQADAAPAQWSEYTVEAVLTNTGSITATGIRVSFARPGGVVYTGGNEFSATQGDFSPYGNQQWVINSLPPGGSATLVVHYFLLQSAAPLPYAQVLAADQPDIDSAPGNGTPPIPNEDDEATTEGNGSDDDRIDLCNLPESNTLQSTNLTGTTFEFTVTNPADVQILSVDLEFETTDLPNSFRITDEIEGPNGYFIVGGYVTDPLPTFKNFLIETDLDGNKIRQYFLPDIDDFVDPFFYDIGDVTGQIYIGYETSSRIGYLIAYDDEGTLLYNLALESDLVSNRIYPGQESSDGSGFYYALSNQDIGPARVVKRDAVTGEIIWDRDMVDALIGPISLTPYFPNTGAVLPTRDGGVAIGVRYSALFTSDEGDLIGKLDADGNALWAIDDIGQFILPTAEDDMGNIRFQANVTTTADGVLIDLCPQIDLSLEINSTTAFPPRWTLFDATVVIQNLGADPATNVVVDLSNIPDEFVFQGGNEYTASQGNFNPYSDRSWNVGTLDANAEASIQLHLFNRTSKEQTLYAQVLRANGTDGDSSPGNGVCCTPAEDDEARLVFNMGQFRLHHFDPEPSSPILELLNVYPNPVTSGRVQVILSSPQAQAANLQLFDQGGRLILQRAQALVEGVNHLFMPTASCSNGLHQLLIQTNEGKSISTRFVVQHP